MANALTKALTGINEYVSTLEEQLDMVRQLSQMQAELLEQKNATISNLQECVDTQSDTIDSLRASNKDLDKIVLHWQSKFECEHEYFVQAADDRDQVIRDKSDLRRRLQAMHECRDNAVAQLEMATSFIDYVAEMIACDCELSDIADEFILWRGGKWTPEEEGKDELLDMLEGVKQYEAEHKWKVMAVDHEGDEAVFTGWYNSYDIARESVDLMVARGCYEAWVEEMI